METNAHKNDRSNWEMPLPFREEKVRMPNNREQATKISLNGLIRTLRRKPLMEQHYVDFMRGILDKGHASPIPPTDNRIPPPGQTWYLPHFGVYHPKKRDKIRVVFDSSPEFESTSLNRELLSGPDLMNRLVGVLMRLDGKRAVSFARSRLPTLPVVSRQQTWKAN